MKGGMGNISEHRIMIRKNFWKILKMQIIEGGKTRVIYQAPIQACPSS